MSAPELLRRDIHPAEVLMPSGALILEARVFVTNKRVLVYKRGQEGIALAHELALAEEAPRASRGTLNGGRLELKCRFDLSEGEQVLPVTINQGGGCGCGSPLKAMKAPVSWTA